MSRPVIRRTGLARLDLVDAALFIAEDNPTAAVRFLDSNFVIFYHPSENGIELVRFLHSSRDVLPLLGEVE